MRTSAWVCTEYPEHLDPWVVPIWWQPPYEVILAGGSQVLGGNKLMIAFAVSASSGPVGEGRCASQDSPEEENLYNGCIYKESY